MKLVGVAGCKPATPRLKDTRDLPLRVTTGGIVLYHLIFYRRNIENDADLLFLSRYNSD
jgi:hypothetical protein